MTALTTHIVSSFLSTRSIGYVRSARPLGITRPNAIFRSSSKSLATSGSGAPADSVPPVDAVIVLGGGLQERGALPPWVHLRLDAALVVYREREGRVSILCSGGGTPHRRPELNAFGYVRHESTVLAEELLRKGLPPSRILKEWSSYDTLGNAFFCLCEHAAPLRWRNPLVITSAFHMPRAIAAFDGVFALGRASGITEAVPSYLATLNTGIDPDVLEARGQRERESLEEFKRKLGKMSTLADFHEMLYATHKCYSVSRQEENGVPSELSEVALKSY